MTPRRIYYLNYIDAKTGFLKREEFKTHHELDIRKQKLKEMGVIHLTEGSYESE